MEMTNQVSKTLIFFGAVLIGTGAVIYLAGRIPGIGRLPGDIFYKKGNFSFFFPLTSSIVISIIATVVLNLFRKK